MVSSTLLHLSAVLLGPLVELAFKQIPSSVPTNERPGFSVNLTETGLTSCPFDLKLQNLVDDKKKLKERL